VEKTLAKLPTGSKEVPPEALQPLVEHANLGLEALRDQARQLVNHGHFKLNGRKVNIPSIRVSPGDVVTLKAAVTIDAVEGTILIDLDLAYLRDQPKHRLQRTHSYATIALKGRRE